PGFVGVAARERLAAVLPVPVVVDNDANVAALGEVLHGAGRGQREVLVVTLGTGIGGGLIINGAVNRGGHGFAAEIGHFTVDRDGGLVHLGGALLAPIRAALPARVEAASLRTVPPVVVAALGEQAGAVGAAALARTLVPPP